MQMAMRAIATFICLALCVDTFLGVGVVLVNEVLDPITPVESDLSQRRVPVVMELPNGTSIVEYMTAAEAERRNLTPATNGGR